MELRKVQEMGGGTLLISLPKNWVIANKIRKSDFLSVESTMGGGLLIHSVELTDKKTKEISITYPVEDMQRLINLITGAYLLGFDVIKVMGNERISYEDGEIMKKAIRQLVGIEIVEEDSKSITSQFLLEPTALDPERTFRRMHMITRGMLSDAIQSLLQSDHLLKKIVSDRDDEVDRLYFLLVRLVRAATLDTQLSTKIKVSTIDCLDYRLSAYLLEAIGDSAVDIANSAGNISVKLINPSTRKSLEKIGSLLEKMQEVSVKSFLSRSPDEGRKIISLYSDVNRELSNLESLVESNNSKNTMFQIIASLNKISRYNVDIADLAFPMNPLVE